MCGLVKMGSTPGKQAAAVDAPSGEAAPSSSARPQSGDEPVLGIAAAQPLRERAPETTEPRGTPSEPRLDEVAFHREPRLDEVAFSPHYGVPPIPETVLSPAPTLLTDCNPKPRESEFSAGVRFASSESERFRSANKKLPARPPPVAASKAEQLVECISDTELDLLLADCENSG